MVLPFFELNLNYTVPKGILTLVDDLVHSFLEMAYMKGRSRTIVLCCCLPFHTVGRSHQKWHQCWFCERVFQCFDLLHLLLWMYDRSLGIWCLQFLAPMYLHNVPDQWTKGNFCSDCYSYLPIARHDLHYTDELIVGTLTQYQMLYGQQLRHERECSSLVFQESFTQMFHWK